jgi:PrtD family type I secretion system ABC transporter
VLTGVFSFAVNLLMLTAPLYMLQVYDRVLTSGSRPTLVALTVLAAGLLLTLGLLEVLRSRVLVRIGLRLDAALNPRVFEASFARQLKGRPEPPNSWLNRLASLRQFLTGQGPFALFDAPWVPLYLAVIYVFHPLLGAVATAGACVLFVLALLNELLTRRPLDAANQAAARAGGFVDGSLRNGEAIAAMGMLPALRARWNRHHAESVELQARASDFGGSITGASRAIRLALQVAILGVGAVLAIEQTITPGVMIAASIIMGRALAPVEQAIGHWRGFLSAREAYRGLAQLMADSPAREDGMALPDPAGRLSVEAVTALPPGGGSAVVRGVTFALAPGEALGIIGASAAGKSSLARVLVGAWAPAAGVVRLDGADVSQFPPADAGRWIGYLPQDVELFDGTVAENIARFRDDATSEQVVAAAREAGVHEMILRLPEGYDTPIGPRGAALSGGQRQRVALARALYGGPALLVLDEPNANLDAEGDSALTRAIQRSRERGAATVVIAHRPSAVAAVDKLAVMAAGEIRDIGPKAEVLARTTQAVPGGEQRPRPAAAGKAGSAASGQAASTQERDQRETRT